MLNPIRVYILNPHPAGMQTRISIPALTFLLAALLFMAPNSGKAQNAITIGTRDSLFSKVLNEKREFWVSVPTTYRPGLSQQKFPVAVVLDGPDHFFSVVGMLDRFSTNTGNEQCPPMIVVGLVNTDRIRDFHPTLENDSFGRFLEEELLPYIDAHYPTEPYRTFIGHSIGGLRVIHTAIYQPHLFDSYIAIDPSLGHFRNQWYEEARNDIEKFDLGNNRMYIGMGQTMPAHLPRDTASIRKDTTDHSNHMRRIMEFCETMSGKSDLENRFDWKYHPDESHQSLTQLVTYDGVSFVFNWYKPTYFGEFLDPATTPERALELMKGYYAMLSKNLGYTVVSPENSGLIWYLFEWKKQKEKALVIAEYNLLLYPKREDAKEWVRHIKEEMGK